MIDDWTLIRSDGQVGNSSCQTLASHLLLYGISLAGLRVQEAQRAFDYLVSREDVDASRIGCFGFSGGGLLAAYTAALDERIQATVLCAFTNTFKGSIMGVRHCIDNYLPGVLGLCGASRINRIACSSSVVHCIR